MAKMQSVRVGSTASRLFMKLPRSQAGWLAKALFTRLCTGEMPKEIPPACEAAWIAVDNEIAAMNYLSELRSAVGRNGGAKTQERNRLLKQTDSLVNQSSSKIEQSFSKNSKETREEVGQEENKEKNAHSSLRSSCAARAPACESEEVPKPHAESALDLGYDCYQPVEAELRRLIPAHVRSLAGIYFVAHEKALTGNDLIDWATYYAELGWRKPSGAYIEDFAASVSRWAVMKQTIKEKDNAKTRRIGGPQGNNRRFDSSRPLSVQRVEFDPNDPINTGEPLPF